MLEMAGIFKNFQTQIDERTNRAIDSDIFIRSVNWAYLRIREKLHREDTIFPREREKERVPGRNKTIIIESARVSSRRLKCEEGPRPRTTWNLLAMVRARYTAPRNNTSPNRFSPSIKSSVLSQDAAYYFFVILFYPFCNAL